MVFNAEDINIIADIEKSAGCKLHNNRQKLSNQFDVIRKLGQGTYGKVHLAVNKDTGQQVAIKSIKKNKIESESDLISIQREIQLMSSVQHPHIIHIYEVLENREKIVLVMEFASGGELYDYLSFKKVFEEDAARKYFRQVAAAVYYCHKNMICHRDLKLENILLDEKGNAKIADFGLSNIFDEKNLHRTFCGSPLYASPEMVQGKPYYGPEVDCWSLGVLLYTLVYGAMPFDGSNFKKLVKQISEGDYYEPKKTSSASGLIKRMLTVNPSKRATIEDICEDEWVNCGTELALTTVAQEFCDKLPVRLDYILSLGAANEALTSGEDEEEEPSLSLNISDSDLNRNAEDGIVSSQSDLATINEGSLDSPFPEEAIEPEDMTESELEENEERKLEDITQTLDSGSYSVVDDSSGEKDGLGNFEISDAELGEAVEKVLELNDEKLGESFVPDESVEAGNEIETEEEIKDLEPELKLNKESVEKEMELEEIVPESEVKEIDETEVPNTDKQSLTTTAEFVPESSTLDKTELIAEENENQSSKVEENLEENLDEITITEESSPKSSEILSEPLVNKTADLEPDLEENLTESSDATLKTESDELNSKPAEPEPEVEPVVGANENTIENEGGTFNKPEENLLESKVMGDESSEIKHEEEPDEVPVSESIGSENISEDITEIKSEKSEKVLKRSQSSFEEKSIKSSEISAEKEPIKVQTSKTISSENVVEDISEKSSEKSEKVLKRSQSSFEKDELNKVPSSKSVFSSEDVSEQTSVRSEKSEKFHKKSQNSFEKSITSSEILPEVLGSKANISKNIIQNVNEEEESSVKCEKSEKVLKRSQSSFEKSSEILPELSGSKSILSKNIVEDVSSVKKSERSEKVLKKSQNSFEKFSFENGTSSAGPSSPLSDTGTRKKLTKSPITEDTSDVEPSGYSMIRTKFRKLNKFGSMEEREYMESVQAREPEIKHCDSFNSSGSNEDFDDFFDSLNSSAMFSNLLDHTQKIMNKFRTGGTLEMSSKRSSSTVSRQFSRSSSREHSLRSSIWGRSSGLEDFLKTQEKVLDDHFSFSKHFDTSSKFSKNPDRHSPTMKRPLRTRTVDLDMREEPEILRRPISTSSGSINRQSPQMKRFDRFERDLERGTSLEDHWSHREVPKSMETSRYRDLSESWKSPTRTRSPRGRMEDDISDSWNLPSSKPNTRGRTTDLSDESWNMPSTRQNPRSRLDDETWNLSSKTRNSRGARTEELSESWNLPSSMQNSRGRKDPMSSLMDSMDDPKQVLKKAKELCNTYKKKI